MKSELLRGPAPLEKLDDTEDQRFARPPLALRARASR